MRVWWTHEGRKTVLGRFYNGRLVYKQGTPEEKITLFSSLEDPFKGTFNIDGFGDARRYLVLTTDLERYSEVEGKNKDKTVLCITLLQSVELESDAIAASLKSILGGRKNPWLLWKQGNDWDPKLFSALTGSTFEEISAKSLYENWTEMPLWFCEDVREEARGYEIHVYFCDQN